LSFFSQISPKLQNGGLSYFKDASVNARGSTNCITSYDDSECRNK